RPLRAAERRAVRDLYFAPRAALAPFAALFENPVGAFEHLVRCGDGDERFGFFRAAFALFHRRCALLAEHLGRHVLTATGGDSDGVEEATRVAWRVLRSLWADENVGLAPWEDDAGAPPEVTWGPWPSGGAFAALLGLLGTGLVGEIGAPPADDGDDDRHHHHRDEDDDAEGEDEEAAPTGPVGLWWREVRGPLTAFGGARDAGNAPVPTVIPALDLQLTPQQSRYVALRNGLALLDAGGEPLGGAQPFAVRWHGVLIVERGGRYRFLGRDVDRHEGHEHD
ncbi:hypothetical protein ACFQ0D_35425, partial [Micromonospora zhanjiangensis]